MSTRVNIIEKHCLGVTTVKVPSIGTESIRAGQDQTVPFDAAWSGSILSTILSAFFKGISTLKNQIFLF